MLMLEKKLLQTKYLMPYRSKNHRLCGKPNWLKSTQSHTYIARTREHLTPGIGSLNKVDSKEIVTYGYSLVKMKLK